MSVSLSCPRCGEPLEQTRQTRWHCRRCGGDLLRQSAVVALLDAAEHGHLAKMQALGYRSAAVSAEAPRERKSSDPVAYLVCPFCGAHMHRTQVLRGDPTVADACVTHGMWFDAGELERVVAGLSHHGKESRMRLRPLVAEHFSRPSVVPESNGSE